MNGRILAAQAVDKRDEDSVKPFLQRFERPEIAFRAFYIDGCQAYYSTGVL